jgi:hypothetical protein
VIQDHVNGNLLFAGTEFGVFTSVDGGQRWVQLKGGMPVAQARDMTIQKRENDLVVATFGRGFYVLDDYSALRELTPQALNEDAALLPLRDAYIYSQTGLAPAGTAGIGPMSGNWAAPNPPYGAVFTYSVKAAAVDGQAGADDQRRRRQADPPPGFGQDVRSAADRVEPARRGSAHAGGRAGHACPAAGGAGGRRPRRQPGPRGRYRTVSGDSGPPRGRQSDSARHTAEFLGASDRTQVIPDP